MFISVSNKSNRKKRKIMKQYKMILVALLGLILTSCYNKFEMPEETFIYNDETFEALNPDLEHITIAELKEIFGNISSTGDTGSFGATKYIRFVADESECTEWEQTKHWYDTGNYYIKGKVISNDEQGNIYKSLYIFDGTAAIELKLTNGLFLDYPCNLETGETMWVYVKLRGLYLGNFRMMLSLGDIPTSSYNSWGTYKYYANSNIVSQNRVREFVFPGEKATLTESATDESADILVIDASSYEKIQGDNTPRFLGRLIRFKGLKVHYAGVPYPDTNGDIVSPEPLLNGSFEQIYPSWLCTSGIQEQLPTTQGGTPTQVVNRPWYHLAYSENNVALYGSLCLTYNDSAKYTSDHGVYMLRTSGYSRFAGKYAPKNGTVGDVLAIYQIYSKYTDFLGGENDYSTYQLAISRIEDLEFEREPKEDSPAWSAHIKWAEDNFPQYVYPAPGVYVPSDEERAVKVAAWKEYYLSHKPANDGSPLWAAWNEWADWVVWILENTPKDSYLLPQQIVEDVDTIE